MIKVCHIISGDMWAGAEVVDYQLLKNLRKFDSLNLSAVLFNDGKLASEIRSLGISVDVVDETQRSFLQIIRDTGKIMNRRSPDVIHSHRYKENILAFLSSKYHNGIRLLCTQHGMPESLGKSHNKRYLLLQRLNISLLSKSFSKVVAVSDDIRNRFIKDYGFTESKVIVIRNGTEIPRSLTTRKDKEAFVIGSMGRLFPVKDYPLMVEIAKEVSRATDNVRFELAGEGPEQEYLRGIVERYHLGNKFLFRGFTENLGDFFQGLDLYLNTSLHEGIPMSILEAMSYGIPVIAADVGGIREIMKDGIEGFLLKERNPKVFAEKILSLYRNRSLRRTMAESARRRVESEFSNDRMAREYYEVYLSLAGGSDCANFS